MNLPNIFESSISPEQYNAGQTIFDEGQPGKVMYIVRQGEVSLMVDDKLVEIVEPNGFFGEMALIEDQSRSGKAVAKTDCQLVPITQRQFMFMVDETPFFALTVMKKMSERLRRIDSQMHTA